MSKPEPWIEFATRDLAAARALFAAGCHLQVGFICQQAAEKMLKAVYVHLRKTLPPKTHDLGVLAAALPIDVAERDARLPFLVELTDLCVRARYPDPNWKETLKQLDRRETAERLLQGTEEAIVWLEAKLKSA